MGLLDGIFGGEFDGREAKIKVSDNGGRTDSIMVEQISPMAMATGM